MLGRTSAASVACARSNWRASGVLGGTAGCAAVPCRHLPHPHAALPCITCWLQAYKDAEDGVQEASTSGREAGAPLPACATGA